ncbi:MAG TPA: GNAT family N-acetyltransferase [Terriglobales bacterium]|nr:GNAT family N-acetyltransferase [Terriglobales bacterium]
MRADLDALASLRPAVHDAHASAHPDTFKASVFDGARREAETWLDQPSTYVLVALLDGEPAGYLRAEVFDRAERELMHARRLLYIDQIALTATARRRGHGKQLLAAGVELARELGIRYVELDVYHFNRSARAFFLSQGFAPLRERLVRSLH